MNENLQFGTSFSKNARLSNKKKKKWKKIPNLKIRFFHFLSTLQIHVLKKEKMSKEKALNDIIIS